MLLPGDHELLLRVVADPGDDGARLVLADLLSGRGDPWGEFIQVQCALAALATDRSAPERRAALCRREGELLNAHDEAWLARLLSFPATARFERGFPEALWADGEALVESGLSVLTPVRALHVRRVGPALRQLLALPWMRRLERLWLQDAHGAEDPRRAFDDDFEPPWAVEDLRLPPALGRVGFDMLARNTLGALAQSGALAHVHTLELELNPGIAAQLGQLAPGRLPALRRLVLRQHRMVPRLGALVEDLDALLEAFPLVRVRWKGVEVGRALLASVDGAPLPRAPARVTATGMPVFTAPVRADFVPAFTAPPAAALTAPSALPPAELPLTHLTPVELSGHPGLRASRGRWAQHHVLVVEGPRLGQDLLWSIERQLAVGEHPHLARCLGFVDARLPQVRYGPLPPWRSLTELMAALPAAAPRPPGSTLGLPLPVGLRVVADLTCALQHLVSEQGHPEFTALWMLARDEVLLCDDGRAVLLPPFLSRLTVGGAEPARPLGVRLPAWRCAGPSSLLALLGSALVHLVSGACPEDDRDRDRFFQRPWLPSWFDAQLRDLDPVVAGCLSRDRASQYESLEGLRESLEGHRRTATRAQVADFLKQLPPVPSMG
jgi:uncharacterized protein (TIGR02996 family)